MMTGIAGLEQLISCILDCRDMRDLYRRRYEAVELFCILRSEGHSCLGPFAIDTNDKSFPVYPLGYSRVWTGYFAETLA